MNLGQILHALWANDQTRAIAVVIALDFVLGVAAALVARPRTFDLAYIGRFLDDDVLKRLVPWASLYAGSLAYSGPLLDVGGRSVGLADVSTVVFGLILAEQGGSILKSLTELGVNLGPLQGLVGRKALNTGGAPIADLGDGDVRP